MNGFKNILGEERICSCMFQTGNTTLDAVFTDWFFGSSVAPAGTQMQINIADSWKAVVGVQINIGDVWKSVVSIKQNIGDVWKTIF